MVYCVIMLFYLLCAFTFYIIVIRCSDRYEGATSKPALSVRRDKEKGPSRFLYFLSDFRSLHFLPDLFLLFPNKPFFVQIFLFFFSLSGGALWPLPLNPPVATPHVRVILIITNQIIVWGICTRSFFTEVK